MQTIIYGLFYFTLVDMLYFHFMVNISHYSLLYLCILSSMIPFADHLISSAWNFIPNSFRCEAFYNLI